jgi:hypothetical protein
MDESELYLHLHDAVIDDIEYLQADSETRYALADTVVISALGAIIGIFANGFFNQLGQQAAEALRAKVEKRAKSAERTADRDALLESLGLIRSHLPLFAQFTEAEREAVKQPIIEALHARGFPVAIAREVANNAVAIMLEAGERSENTPDA